MTHHLVGSPFVAHHAAGGRLAKAGPCSAQHAYGAMQQEECQIEEWRICAMQRQIKAARDYLIVILCEYLPIRLVIVHSKIALTAFGDFCMIARQGLAEFSLLPSLIASP
ncbi:MAG: hypothetical protein KGL12_09185 [Rhodospirillales bacterium]|nr:hypothetical protein [Rhodospirillales bacterium]